MKDGPDLVADIGGTHVRFALVAHDGAQPAHEMTLLCADFQGLEQAARHYLEKVGVRGARRAAFDVATAVTADLVKLTNSPWAFSIEQTRRALELDQLLVINDFTALALSLTRLQPDELHKVGGGEGVSGAPVALIGAGTGLGVSGLFPTREGWLPIQGEGGHVAFSPVDEREDGVLRVLRARFGHVSAERVMSGPGLVAVYEALCTLDHVVAKGLKPEQVTDAGIAGTDPHCVEAIRIFCGALGTASANLVVTLGARGGLYIGGGIVPRLGDYFFGSPFRRRFEHKGRFSRYVSEVPTWIILAETPALRGLAFALETNFAG
ncbi:MAG: glucokinase [Proteobacteria bacterium]|nr:MAG: glucokinase [Pseudomonadota bacterium]